MMIVGGRHKRLVTQCIEPKRQALSIVACVCVCVCVEFVNGISFSMNASTHEMKF